MFKKEDLSLLQSELVKEYEDYSNGVIDEKEYLEKIKPIDKKIDIVEMSVIDNCLEKKAV